MLEFSRIETLAGVRPTLENRYDSFVAPLKRGVENERVKIVTGSTMMDLEH